MDAAEKLIALGAYSCGGTLIYKNKEMGHSRNGVLQLTPEGEAFLALNIEDAVIKSEKPKTKRKKEAEPIEVPLEAAAFDDFLMSDE